MISLVLLATKLFHFYGWSFSQAKTTVESVQQKISCLLSRGSEMTCLISLASIKVLNNSSLVMLKDLIGATLVFTVSKLDLMEVVREQITK